ncbi:MAG: polysaccharide export protein [Thiotrichales bacterium]|nr:MAG: polysaccharide export protein [Thiotrichales bacterium]
MKKFKLPFIPYFLILFTALLISACSSMESGFSDSATNEQGRKIFSDNRELDYTPPKKEYRIGSSDLLNIKVFQAEELSQSVRVDPRGNISMPLIGSLRAEGLSQSQLENAIAQKLKAKYLQNPQVTVAIEEFTKQRVTVEGEVKTAGVYPIQGEITLLQAIALAGGPSNLADPAKTVIFRKQGNTVKAYNLNLDSIREGKMRDPYILNDDRIIIHRSGSRYWLREMGILMSPIRLLNPLVN